MTFIVNPRQLLLIRPPDPRQDSALISQPRPRNLPTLVASLREGGFTGATCDCEVPRRIILAPPGNFVSVAVIAPYPGLPD